MISAVIPRSSARWNKESKKEVPVATFLFLTSKSPYKGGLPCHPRQHVERGGSRERENAVTKHNHSVGANATSSTMQIASTSVCEGSGRAGN
jgi:hypothetical protein